MVILRTIKKGWLLWLWWCVAVVDNDGHGDDHNNDNGCDDDDTYDNEHVFDDDNDGDTDDDDKYGDNDNYDNNSVNDDMREMMKIWMMKIYKIIYRDRKPERQRYWSETEREENTRGRDDDIHKER